MITRDFVIIRDLVITRDFMVTRDLVIMWSFVKKTGNYLEENGGCDSFEKVIMSSTLQSKIWQSMSIV